MSEGSGRSLDRIPEAVYQQAREIVISHRRFVLTTYCDPDADGLGAEAALAEALRQLGKDVRGINDGPVPAYYRFLRGSGSFEAYRESVHPPVIGSAEWLFCSTPLAPNAPGGSPRRWQASTR